MKIKMMTRTLLLAPLAAALLAACSTVPPLAADQLAVPAAYKEDSPGWKPAQPAEAQERGQWWRAFRDPVLDELEERAAASSPTAQAAAARVRQARALAGMASAARSPQVQAGVGATRSRPSDAALGLVDGTPVAPANLYRAQLSASYEADLFGRIGAAARAAGHDAAASQAAYRSALLSLQADVAQAWLRLRALDAELETVERAVRLRDESVRLTQRRFELGDIGEFDLSRARTELSAARAELAAVRRERTALEHALATLVGTTPAQFEAKPTTAAAELPQIPAGLPSALLERRPDISAAQQALFAANARIGEARAARFPSLTLSAAAGTETGAGANLLAAGARSWMAGALLALPLLDGGRNRANADRADAARDEALANYRQQVLTAFREVEDNLSGLRLLSEQAREVDDAVVSARRAAELALKLYQAGRSGYVDLLDAQRNLAAVERSAAQLRGERAVTTVALVRALGGGWN